MATATNRRDKASFPPFLFASNLQIFLSLIFPDKLLFVLEKQDSHELKKSPSISIRLLIVNKTRCDGDMNWTRNQLPS